MIALFSREYPSSGPSCSIGWPAMTSIQDVRAALRRALAEWVDSYPRAARARRRFLSDRGRPYWRHRSVCSPFRAVWNRNPNSVRLIRHRPAALLLATDRVKALAERGLATSQFCRRFPHDLVQEAALAIAGNALALQHLSEWLRHGELSATSSHGGESASCRGAGLAS